MNYLTQIQGFWRLHEEYTFTTTEIALYFYLLKVCNACNWKNPFRRNNIRLRADLDLSFNTMNYARIRLQESGLISYETFNGTPDVTYTLTEMDRDDGPVLNKDGRKRNIQNQTNQTGKRKNAGRFTPPTQKEIEEFFVLEKNLDTVQAHEKANRFFYFYESKNWMIGKNKMSNWKAAAVKSLDWENTKTSAHSAAGTKKTKTDGRF